VNRSAGQPELVWFQEVEKIEQLFQIILQRGTS